METQSSAHFNVLLTILAVAAYKCTPVLNLMYKIFNDSNAISAKVIVYFSYDDTVCLVSSKIDICQNKCCN